MEREYLPTMLSKHQATTRMTIEFVFSEEYVPLLSKKKSPKQKQTAMNAEKLQGSVTILQANKSEKSVGSVFENAVPILAYYDDRNQIVQVSIKKYLFRIHRRVMLAVSYCLPYQYYLTKFTIGKGSLTRDILHVLSEQLPRSHLTEICIEDANVPNADYHVLLNQVSKLKHLSLRRCHVQDFECTEIAKRLSFGGPADSLQTLDLTSNCITDVGAQSLGKMLKKNRELRHLGLASNEISNIGASYILDTLREFPLDANDILEKRSKRIEYMRKRCEVYKKCLLEVISHQQGTYSQITTNPSKGRPSVPTIKPKLPKKSAVSEVNVNADVAAELNTNKIMGKDFEHAYNKSNMVLRDGYCYCTGNFRLCSLNLAYNYLDYHFLKYIIEILEYQMMMRLPGQSCGLVRLVVDGNNLPIDCLELHQITFLLQKGIIDCSALCVQSKKRLSFSSRRWK